MKKLLLLSLLLVGCKSYVTEIPSDKEHSIYTSFMAKNPHRVVLFVEHGLYYKVAQKYPPYKEAKERISSLLPAASKDCLCGFTMKGGFVRIDAKKSWIIDIDQLPTIAALVLYGGKGKTRGGDRSQAIRETLTQNVESLSIKNLFPTGEETFVL